MRTIAAALVLLFPVLLLAQESPYAGEQYRAVKALSAEEVQQLLRGDGMGMAKAAELNHYPGPRHVLQMAPQLGLSDQQIAQSKSIIEHMQADARALGRQIVDREQELDRLFQSGEITSSRLEELVRQIGEMQGQLRAVHLRAHLEERALLTPEQLRQYDDLRGYGHTHNEQHF